MTQVELITRMIELGYFDFFGLGTDSRAAENALESAARIDADVMDRVLEGLRRS